MSEREPSTSEVQDAFVSLRKLEQFYRWSGDVARADEMARTLRQFSIHHIDGRVVWKWNRDRAAVPRVDPSSQAVYLPKEPPAALIQAMKKAMAGRDVPAGLDDLILRAAAREAYAALRAWLGLED